MTRVLVVANRTACEQHLLDEVARRRAAGPCEVHLLVPKAHPAGTWTDDQVADLARERLAEALAELSAHDIDATGSIGDANPVTAVGDLLRHDRFDEIVVSTLPQGISRWLGQNVVKRIRSAHGLPVTHVVAEPAAVR
jgi:hypothetical protein